MFLFKVPKSFADVLECIYLCPIDGISFWICSLKHTFSNEISHFHHFDKLLPPKMSMSTPARLTTKLPDVELTAMLVGTLQHPVRRDLYQVAPLGLPPWLLVF